MAKRTTGEEFPVEGDPFPRANISGHNSYTFVMRDLSVRHRHVYLKKLWRGVRLEEGNPVTLEFDENNFMIEIRRGS
ncbi:MAG: hypothetical protein ABIU05_21585 [Nitrospirales bacterium]